MLSETSTATVLAISLSVRHLHPLNSVSQAGSVYVVFGGAAGANKGTGTAWTACPCVLNNTFLNGTNGVEFDGAATNERIGAWSNIAGTPLMAVGDVNGDNIADLVIGGGYTTAHYVIFGKTNGWSGTATTLTSGINPLDGTHGFELDGDTGAVAVGDVNGDGIGDIITMSCCGQYAAVVFGHSGLWSAQNDISAFSSFFDGSKGYQIIQVGSAYTSFAIGDVNGDGVGDILLGIAEDNYHGGYWDGQAALVFGQKCGGSGTPCTTPINLSSLNGTNGVMFDSAALSVAVGWSVATADLNGDGIPDLLIWAPGASPNGVASASSTYVVFGKKKGKLWPAIFDLDGL